MIEYEKARRLFKRLAMGNACREGQMSRRLSGLGLAVPDVVAYGREIRQGLLIKDVLITKEVPRAQRLYDLVFQVYPSLAASEKRRFIELFAKYLRALHIHGVQHFDLHMGNILVQGDLTNPRFFLLDTDRVRLRRVALKSRQRAKNLGLLLTNFQKLTTRSERFRFLKHYSLDMTEPFHLAPLIERYSLQISRKTWRKKAQCSLGHGRDFRCLQMSGVKVWEHMTESGQKLVKEMLPDPNRLLEGGRVLKSGRTVLAAEVDASGEKWFLKRFNDKGRWYRFRNAFRRSRALRTWINSWEFWQRGLPVPAPIVCIESRQWRCLRQSYLAYEFVEDSRRLTEVWPQLTEKQSRGLLIRIALILGRMHRMGCFHGDLKWNNMLVDPAGRIHIVDLDGSLVKTGSGSRFKYKDIQRFLSDMSRYKVDDKSRKLFMDVWSRWSMPMPEVNCDRK
ncbi:MAG: hypothetical protein KAT93_00485 [Desulfuromonadales bacterium]|nr:hypothetical protein [Desulfuromonadales bacterium]